MVNYDANIESLRGGDPQCCNTMSTHSDTSTPGLTIDLPPANRRTPWIERRLPSVLALEHEG